MLQLNERSIGRLADREAAEVASVSTIHVPR